MGTHEYNIDSRNDEILIYVNGEIVPRSIAKVSVFDSGFLLGDGVWEGIRYHNNNWYTRMSILSDFSQVLQPLEWI